MESEYLTAVYEVNGPEAQAWAHAKRIALDQTIEGDRDLLPAWARPAIVGSVEDLRPGSAGRYEATIRYAGELVGNECADLLNLLFGTSSLRADIRLVSFTMTRRLLSSWRGPRFGVQGLRQALGVFRRPLICAVLKPVGLAAAEFATLATEFVRGGADLIKDDQGLLDQPFCPFEDRVARCAEAIAAASAKRGRPCLYFAHVSGSLDTMRQRAAKAKVAGAAGLLIAPGLTGFDAFRALASDETTLPIASHPSSLGIVASGKDAGLAPPLVYGVLARLAGADVSIYPSYEADYAMSQEDCLSVATDCRRQWDHLLPTMPAIGGRMNAGRVGGLIEALGRDITIVLGSRIQQDPRGVMAAMEDVHRALASFR